MTFTYELDLDMVKLNHLAKYLSQSSKVDRQTDRQTHKPTDYFTGPQSGR